MDPQPWYTSKTILINAGIAVALAVLAVLQSSPTWDKSLWIAAAIAGLNALNRFATATPIAGTPAARRLAVARRLLQNNRP